MVPATQTVMLHLLAGKHQRYTNWPQHQVMVGHNSRVNCLLYPNNEHPRYDVAHLVSGSVDFTVCLWDIYTGALLHRFCCQVNEEFRYVLQSTSILFLDILHKDESFSKI